MKRILLCLAFTVVGFLSFAQCSIDSTQTDPDWQHTDWPRHLSRHFITCNSESTLHSGYHLCDDCWHYGYYN